MPARRTCRTLATVVSRSVFGRVIGGVLAVLLVSLLGACATTITGTGLRLGQGVPGMPTPHVLQFRDCTASLQHQGLRIPSDLSGHVAIGCGTLAVPLDYARPRAASLDLTVVRIHDTDNHAGTPQALLLNPGGPGGSGLAFALGFMSEVPASIVAHYDLVGFDPRGVGESDPVHCLTDKQKDALLAEAPDVSTAAGLAAAQAQARQVAAACGARLGAALGDFTTVNTARDMDQLRQALGNDRMNYLGFSYGTELGWTYAHLFPGRVRAFVLDGAVDPQAPNGVAQATEQMQGFEQAFDQFAAWCAAQAQCAALGATRSAAEALARKAERAPLRTSSGRPLTFGLAMTGVLGALYSRSTWSVLAQALHAAVHGDGTGLLRLADDYNQRSPGGTYSNIYDANAVISCNDTVSTLSASQAQRTATTWATRYPLFGRFGSSSLVGCVGWPARHTPVPPPEAATPTTVLVLGNLHDPATPYVGAQRLARELGHGELLSWDGEGHTSYLNGSSCIDRAVDTYLLTLRPPTANTVCPAK